MTSNTTNWIDSLNQVPISNGIVDVVRSQKPCKRFQKLYTDHTVFGASHWKKLIKSKNKEGHSGRQTAFHSPSIEYMKSKRIKEREKMSKRINWHCATRQREGKSKLIGCTFTTCSHATLPTNQWPEKNKQIYRNTLSPSHTFSHHEASTNKIKKQQHRDILNSL